MSQSTITSDRDVTPKKRGRPAGSKAKTPEVLPPATSGLKPTFKSIFLFVGNILVSSFTFDGFKVSENEGEMLSEQADSVIMEFTPEVGNKWVKLGIFITSLLTIFGKKWFDFEIKKKKDKLIKKELNTKDKNTNSNPTIETAHIMGCKN